MGCIKDVEIVIRFTGKIETKTEEEADQIIEGLDAETVWNDRGTFWVEGLKKRVTDTVLFEDDDETTSTDPPA